MYHSNREYIILIERKAIQIRRLLIGGSCILVFRMRATTQPHQKMIILHHFQVCLILKKIIKKLFFNICITVIQRKALSHTANYQITKDLRACRDSVLPLFPWTKQLPPRYWCHLGLWQYQGFPSLQHMVIDHDNMTHGQIMMMIRQMDKFH